jgi:hypothetical protein
VQREADRPALTDVVITPAMLAAGKEAFRRWVSYGLDGQAVQEIPSDESLAWLIAEVLRSIDA